MELKQVNICRERNKGIYISYVCFNDAQGVSTFVCSNLGPDWVELVGVTNHLKNKYLLDT